MTEGQEYTDYYAVLGLTSTAEGETVRRAYRQRMKLYAPGGSDPDQAAYELANCAYRTLSDPAARASYDRLLSAGASSSLGEQAALQRFMGRDPYGLRGAAALPAVATLAGAQAALPLATCHEGDVFTSLSVSFAEAVLGANVTVLVNHLTACYRCAASGVEPGYAAEPCPVCQGRGSHVSSQPRVFQPGPVTTACSLCQGAGQVIISPCHACSGEGRVRTYDRVAVAVPAGVADRSLLRLVGQGHVGIRGATAGTLRLMLRVEGHPFYRRAGDDLMLELPLSLTQAVLGATLSVPVLGQIAPASVAIAAGAQGGQEIRIAGGGVPTAAGRGDLVLRLVVKVPTDLTPVQASAWGELPDLLGIKQPQLPWQEQPLLPVVKGAGRLVLLVLRKVGSFLREFVPGREDNNK